MTFTFLQEEIESILLFATAPVYITIIALLQSKNLKILDQLRSEKTNQIEQKALIKRLRKLKFLTPLFMLIGISVHIMAYLFFASLSIRSGYFVSICMMYVIYVLIAWINFYLKGAGILKDIGNFNGLPGN
ncbi:MAG: hypothetical protein ACJAUD_000068 [Crocinitomicaceae bacterium]|jgi:hypothetical protein